MHNMKFRSIYLVITILIASILLVSAGCSKTTSTTTATTTSSAVQTTSTTTAATTTAFTVKTASKTGIGDFLVDSKGMTLYYFTKDVIGKSTPTGAVLAAWPLFNPSNFVVPSSLQAFDFAVITRDDGQKVATYKGWPLYYYAKDLASGDTLGEAVGGVWFVIKVPFYTVMLQNKAVINNYLVDSKGMTLYWTSLDTAGKSNVTGTILANWPVFASANTIIPSSLNSADFGSITRTDGSTQRTYKGWPLYYYINDKTSGDTIGQGVNGVWFAANPTSSGPAAPATTTTITATTTATTTASTTTAPTTTTTVAGTPITINLAAQNMAFDKNSITVTTGAAVTLIFNNKDTIPHNFALYTNSSATPPAIFVGQTVTGPTTVTYTFTAPSTPGTYFFRCDVHPTSMTGSFIVTAPSTSGY